MNIFLLRTWIKAKLSGDECGASMVEYAFLVGLIAMVCIAAVSFLGTSLSPKYEGVGNSLT